MSVPELPCYVANRPLLTDDLLPVRDKYQDTIRWKVSRANAAHMEAAMAGAVQAAPAMAHLPPHARRSILRHCLERLHQQAATLATVLVQEGGKPLTAAHAEVERLLRTFELAAEAAGNPAGAFHDLRGSPLSGETLAWERRFPVGPCAFITPFNFPLNLVAHKVAPAIAAGCPFILKPASNTPVSALMLGEILAETDLPAGAFSIVPCSREVANVLVEDDRLRFLSFTGSAAVGWNLKMRAGKKRVTLELGGNAACIVAADADLERALPRIVQGGFGNSGQSCISIQRILVHHSREAAFRDQLLSIIAALPVGDPARTDTVVGPLIDEDEAIRLEKWVAEAQVRGARVLCGGNRQGAIFRPTVLEAVPEDCSIWAEEAFGPVVVMRAFSHFDEALAVVNASRYGLQAAVFTDHLPHVLLAWESLEVGAVVINEAPSFRADAMPYGGVKDSGLGREGVRSAMLEMTEPRLLVFPHAVEAGRHSS